MRGAAIAAISPAEPARDRSPWFQPGVSWSLQNCEPALAGDRAGRCGTSPPNAPRLLSPAKAGLQSGGDLENPRLKPGATTSSRLRRQNVQSPGSRDSGSRNDSPPRDP